MKNFGAVKLVDSVIQAGLCCGCGACINLCPYFQSYRGNTAPLFPCNLETGRCFAYCPKVELDPDALSRFLFGQPYDGSPLGHVRSIHVSRAGARVKQQAFQSGGTVSALVYFAMRSKRRGCAVLTGREGFLPVPSLVKRPADVFRQSLSKYAAAPTLSALNRAVAEGCRDLGVVATPCQAAAVAQMRSNPMKDPSFTDPTALVVGLFCTWALDFRRFEAFLAGRVSVPDIVKVDVPPPPASVLEVYLKEGKREFSLDEIRALVPEACLYCPDMTAEFADVSVGVLEGPTSGLDPVGRRLVRDIIHDLRRGGRTVFLNSHLLSEVEITCDRVAFIKHGMVLRTSILKDLVEGELTVEVRARGLTPDVVSGLSRWSPSVRADGEHLSLTLPGEADLPEINRYLVGLGVDGPARSVAHR